MSNDETGDKHCLCSSSLTAIGGNDGILVSGLADREGDFAGVGRWGRGNSDMGEALALAESSTSCRNGMSGDSDMGATSCSFAFSCWYWIQAAISALSALIRPAQNVMMPAEGSVRFLYSTRSCCKCVWVSLGKTCEKGIVVSGWIYARGWTHE